MRRVNFEAPETFFSALPSGPTACTPPSALITAATQAAAALSGLSVHTQS
ncbi:MAG TPA: hypothetical protein VFH51_05535 [Myxococcota bacterium]|nr:hypothetical protein [Myxococcota bacterium]